MSRYWNSRIHDLTPYVPGEQPKDLNWIKLNTNENPYPPSPAVLKAIASATDSTLRLYPDPDGTQLREQIANRLGLETAEVFVGNGSDEILGFSFMTFFEAGKTVRFPDVTYSFYPVYAKHFGLDFETVPLDDNFQINVDQLVNVARGGGGVLIPNPNAPTGISLPLASIRTILQELHDQVVIIDEAYIDFGGESATSLVREFPNLLVVQTFSKSRSLAGLRVGFALGQAHLIEGLQRVKHSFNSYTLDRLALAGSIEALKDEAYFTATRQQIINTRERVIGALREKGFQVLPSHANFFFMTHHERSAKDLFDALRSQGILVRHFKLPRIENYLRVTVGTDEEMDAFLRVIDSI